MSIEGVDISANRIQPRPLAVSGTARSGDKSEGEITVGGIKFQVQPGLTVDNTGINSQIAELINSVRRVGGQFKATTVLMTNDVPSASYDPVKGKVMLNLKFQDWREALAHELSHGVFHSRFTSSNLPYGRSADQALQSLYYSGMQNSNYLIIKDSTFSKVPGFEYIGHPYDSPNEWFASASAIFMQYGSEFMARINDPQIPQGTREYGKAVFLYLRDKVYGGVFVDSKYCGRNTPEFAASERATAGWQSPAAPGREETIALLRQTAAASPVTSERIAAVYSLMIDLNVSDPNFADMLVSAWNNRGGDGHMRPIAADNMIKAIGLLRQNDPRLLAILKDIISNDTFSNYQDDAIKLYLALGGRYEDVGSANPAIKPASSKLMGK